MAKVLNIEVGDRVTKICVSEKNKKGYQISNSFLMQTPVGAVRDGQIIAIIVPGPCRFFGLFGCRDDYVIPWCNIRRIGPDIILVDVKPEECCVSRGKFALPPIK